MLNSLQPLTCVGQPDDGGVVLGEVGDAWQDVLRVDVDVVPWHLFHQCQHLGQRAHSLGTHPRYRVTAEVQQVRRDAVQQDVDPQPWRQVEDELQCCQLGVTGLQRLQAGGDDGHQDDEALPLPGAHHTFATLRQGGGAWMGAVQMQLLKNKVLCVQQHS